MQNYEKLNEFGIYVLRNIGRDIGVKDVTKLKKMELIEEIKKIANKEVEPYVRKTSKGRPVTNAMPKFGFLNDNEKEIKYNLELYRNINYDLKLIELYEEYYNNTLNEIYRFKQEILKLKEIFEYKWN